VIELLNEKEYQSWTLSCYLLTTRGVSFVELFVRCMTLSDEVFVSVRTIDFYQLIVFVHNMLSKAIVICFWKGYVLIDNFERVWYWILRFFSNWAARILFEKIWEGTGNLFLARMLITMQPIDGKYILVLSNLSTFEWQWVDFLGYLCGHCKSALIWASSL